jgi:RNA polymerase sigma-70 factor (ECF subfamily)
MQRPADHTELIDLLIAYQAGEAEAFARLYTALAPDVRQYFARTVRDTATNDLVQETFLELYRSRHTYTPPLPVRPWVFGIARHVRWRHRRAIRRRSEHEAPATEEMPARRMLTHGLDAHDLDQAIERLPPTRRAAWLLHHVHGFSFQEVARRLRIGVGAAKLRSSRAMRTLRAMLESDRGAHDG